MNQLTIRGFSDEVARTIRRIANRDGTSLNRAALKLLRKGAGLGHGRAGSDTVGSSLDHLIGSWDPVKADEVDCALRDFETIDESAWK